MALLAFIAIAPVTATTSNTANYVVAQDNLAGPAPGNWVLAENVDHKYSSTTIIGVNDSGGGMLGNGADTKFATAMAPGLGTVFSLDMTPAGQDLSTWGFHEMTSKGMYAAWYSNTAIGTGLSNLAFATHSVNSGFHYLE